MLANAITLLRVLLLFAATVLILQEMWAYSLVAAALILVIISLDWADGYVARKLNTATPAGAVMDILADRIVENVLWIIFAFAGVIPIWVPVVVLIRGLLTDAVRSVALASGRTAFGPRTMMDSAWGRAIVSSETSRTLYAVLKAVVFSYLALFLAAIQAGHLGGSADWLLPYLHPMAWVGTVLSITTVLFCVVRGIPVVVEGWRFVRSSGAPPAP